MLFDLELIPGLAVRDELITPEKETALIGRIGELNLTPFKFQGFTGKRLTTSFGWAYNFDRGGLGKTDPIPDWLLPVRDLAASLAGIEPDELVQALVIRYDPGAGIGWHRDRPIFDRVVGLSLGAPATLSFRQRTATGFRRIKLPLTPRGAYSLSGEVRHEWEHGIAAHDALRFSITFRSLSERSPRR